MEHNFIITNGNNDPRDKQLFFGDEDVTLLPNDTDMFDLLVRIGIFKSKTQARKNWTKTGRDIPDGFFDLQKISKQWHRITTLKPIGRWEE